MATIEGHEVVCLALHGCHGNGNICLMGDDVRVPFYLVRRGISDNTQASSTDGFPELGQGPGNLASNGPLRLCHNLLGNGDCSLSSFSQEQQGTACAASRDNTGEKGATVKEKLRAGHSVAGSSPVALRPTPPAYLPGLHLPQPSLPPRDRRDARH